MCVLVDPLSLLLIYQHLGPGVRASNQRYGYPCEISRELIPHHLSNATRNIRHNLFPPHRGRPVLSLPSLSTLALDLDIIRISVGLDFLQLWASNDRKSRAMRTSTDPTATRETPPKRGPGKDPAPWEQDRLINREPRYVRYYAITRAVRVFQAIRGAINPVHRLFQE